MATVRNILRNPTYTGDQTWNRRHVGKHFGILNGEITSDSVFVEQDGQRQSMRQNPKEDWVIIRNAHPALVSRELFERVQNRLGKRKGRHYQSRGLGLTGLVFCAHCGASMGTCPYRQVYKTQTYFYRKLVCPTARIAGSTVCRSRMVAEPALLEYVVRTLCGRVIDDRVEERLRSRLQADFGIGFKRGQAAMIRLREDIQRYEEMIDRATENLLLVPPNQVQRAVSKISIWQVKHDTAVSRFTELEAGKPYNIERLISETMRSSASPSIRIARSESRVTASHVTGTR